MKNTDASNFNAQIGQRIRACRKEQKKAQNYFADLIYVSPSFLNQIEFGKRRPSLETLLRISRISNCTVDFLLSGEQLQEDNNFIKYQSLSLKYSSKEIAKGLDMLEFYLNQESEDK